MFMFMELAILNNEVLYIGQVQKEWLSRCPLYLTGISAGFPLPSEEVYESSLDLHQLMVKNGEATFLLKVQSYAMDGAGIFCEDLVVVDRSIPVQNGHIVIVFINNAFIIRRFIKRGRKILLQSDNNQYASIEIEDEDDFEIWGIVTFVIHKP